MSDLSRFISDLRNDQITLWLDDDDQLRYKAPAGALTAEWTARIRSRRNEIVDFLKATSEPFLVPRGLQGRLPTSFVQEMLVKAYERYTNPRTAHMLIAKRLSGRLSTSALKRSLELLCSRHSILRARYVRPPDGSTWVTIEEPAAIDVELADLSSYGLTERYERATTLVSEARRERFDLYRAPLFRAKLLKLDDEDHVLVLTLHHSLGDAFSLAILVRDLAHAYQALQANESPTLPTLPVQYTDYARWFREWMASRAGEEHLRYWKHRVKDARMPFWLPKDEPRPDDVGPVRYADGLEISLPVVAALRAVAQREATTVPMALLAAFATVLRRWGGSDDVFVGVMHLGRLHPEVMELIGCFMQAWMLRVNIEGESDFTETLRQVHRAHVEAFDHLQVPFWRMKEAVAAFSSESPLLHVTFNYIPMMPVSDAGNASSSELAMRDFPEPRDRDPLDEATGQKLVVYFHERPEGIRGVLRYSAQRFCGATIDQFWCDFESLLATVASQDRIERCDS